LVVVIAGALVRRLVKVERRGLEYVRKSRGVQPVTCLPDVD
jgi:hypothetical protein